MVLASQLLCHGDSRKAKRKQRPNGRASAHYETLVEALQQVKTDRHGVVALVTGEPGVGKSRLVQEVLAPASEHFLIVRAECSPTEGHSYGVLAQLLAGLAGADPHDPPDAQRRALDKLLRDSPVSEVRPILRELLGGEEAEAAVGEPSAQPDSIRSAVRRLLAWQARRRAALLVVDDLQWSDTASLQLLAGIIDLLHESGCALIVIARAEARTRLVEAFGGQSETAPLHLELGPLPAAEADELVEALLVGRAASPAMRRELVSLSAGNPLLLAELVRMLADAGVLQEGRVDPRWRGVIQAVPDTVNGLILNRYDQLPTGSKALLEAAAVLVPAFTSPLMAGTAGVSEQEVRHQLGVLEEAGFVRGSAGSGQTRYYFQHALLREAIYETLLHDERRALHLRAAEILRRPEADASAAIIGRHLEQAGEQAAARFANEEAEACYRRAHALLGPHTAAPEEHVELALRLAELLLHTGHFDAAQEQLTQAAGFGYREGDLHFHTGRSKALQGAHAEALTAFQTAKTALAEAPQTCQTFDIGDVEREMGWVAYRQGAFTAAKRRAERALAHARQRANASGEASAYNLLTPAL